LVAPGEVHHALAAALAGVGLGDVGQLAVRIEAGGIGAEDDGQRGDGAVVVHAAVEQRALLPGFIDAVADHDEGAGVDLRMLGIVADLVHAALDVGVEFLAVGEAAAAGEDGFGGFGGELLAVFGGAGLHDDRPALHGAGDVEGAAHLEIFAVVV